MYNNLLITQVHLLVGDQYKLGYVKGYKRDSDGQLIGKPHPNPLLNTRLYLFQFTDDSVHDYTANMITEAIYTEVDDEGNKYLLLDSNICYHKNDKAISKNNMQVISQNGNRHIIKTTANWEVCVQWKDWSSSSTMLANFKSSHPLQVADFAVAHQIDTEPAFAWWIPAYTNVKNRIIKAVKGRCLK